MKINNRKNQKAINLLRKKVNVNKKSFNQMKIKLSKK